MDEKSFLFRCEKLSMKLRHQREPTLLMNWSSIEQIQLTKLISWQVRTARCSIIHAVDTLPSAELSERAESTTESSPVWWLSRRSTAENPLFTLTRAQIKFFIQSDRKYFSWFPKSWNGKSWKFVKFLGNSEVLVRFLWNLLFCSTFSWTKCLNFASETCQSWWKVKSLCEN